MFYRSPYTLTQLAALKEIEKWLEVKFEELKEDFMRGRIAQSEISERSRELYRTAFAWREESLENPPIMEYATCLKGARVPGRQRVLEAIPFKWIKVVSIRDKVRVKNLHSHLASLERSGDIEADGRYSTKRYRRIKRMG